MSSNPYTEILAALAYAEVECVLCGGLACVLHGSERVTLDVDLSVRLAPENLVRFAGVMEALGLRPLVAMDPRALLDPRVVRALVEDKHALVFTYRDPERPIRQVDLFLRAELSYETLLPSSEWVELDGFRFRVLSAAKLLELKRAIQPPRPKDALDLEFLRNHVRA